MVGYIHTIKLVWMLDYTGIIVMISCVDGSLFKSHKLIVLKSLRKDMLNLIHEAHTGIVKCNSRSRETLFGLVWQVT